MARSRGSNRVRSSGADSQDAVALQLAAAQKRDEFLEVAGPWRLEGPGEADGDHLWLRAEWLHSCGRFLSAQASFGEWVQRFGADGPRRWMYLLARLRLAYYSINADHGHDLRSHLREAERFLRAHESDLEAYLPDLELLRGRQLELQGTLELARARIEVAYAQATRLEQWAKAAFLASQIGRLLSEMHRISDAMEWQQRGMENLSREPHVLHDRVIRVRLAKIQIAMRRRTAAREALERVRSECLGDVEPALGNWCRTAQPLLAAWTAIHEIDLMESKDARAEESLQSAMLLASQLGLRNDLVHLHRDHARLCLSRLQPSPSGDGKGSPLGATNQVHPSDHGSREFQLAAESLSAAIDLAVDSPDPRPVTLLALADDLLFQPDLVRHLKDPQRARLLRGLRTSAEDLRRLLESRLHGHTRLPMLRSTAADGLRRQLEQLRNDRLCLAGAIVRMGSGEVTKGGKLAGHLQPIHLVFLDLVDRYGPIGSAELSRRGIKNVAKTASEIRRMVGQDSLPLLPRTRGARYHLLREQSAESSPVRGPAETIPRAAKSTTRVRRPRAALVGRRGRSR